LHTSSTLVEAAAVNNPALEPLHESGESVLRYVFLAGPVMHGGALKGVILASKSGREDLLAKTLRDRTGAADVGYRAGVPCQQGNDQGGVQPPTLMFCLGGVATEELRLSIAEEPRTYLTDFIPSEYFGQNNQFIVVGLRSLMQQAREHGFNLP